MKSVHRQARRWLAPRIPTVAAPLVALLVSLFLVARGEAQFDPTGNTAARALYEEGRKLADERRFDEACPKFRRSYELDSTFTYALLGLGTCYRDAGKTASAWATLGEAREALRRAAAADPDNIKKEELRRYEERARSQQEELAARLSRLIVDVPHEARVDGLVVRVGTLLVAPAMFGVGLPVDPGKVIVEATAPGRAPWSQTVAVPEGPAQTNFVVPMLELLPSASSGTAPSTPAPGVVPPATLAGGKILPAAEDGGGTQRIAGWTIGAIGVVGLAFGIGFGVDAMSKNSNSKDYCPNTPTECTQEGADLRNQAFTSARVSTGAFIIGGAGLVTGVVLLLTVPSDDSDDPPSGSAADVGLCATPAGVALFGRW
jgi:hypothetical protein